MPTPAEDETRMLREAAISMREEHGISHPRHEMWFTFADLLQGEARLAPVHRDSNVIKVARAYLAARSRPDISDGLDRQHLSDEDVAARGPMHNPSQPSLDKD